jgi:hypothetical protein
MKVLNINFNYKRSLETCIVLSATILASCNNSPPEIVRSKSPDKSSEEASLSSTATTGAKGRVLPQISSTLQVSHLTLNQVHLRV